MAESRPSNVTLNINGNRTEDQSRAVYGWIEGDVHQHFHSSANPSDAQEREVIARLKDLSTDPHVIRERLISSKDKRVPGTCEWITNNATYRAWLAVDSDTRLLWISGGPGKGKTMMSIFLTEELERLTVIKDDAEVVYFFCLNGEEERNTATAVLRGLVYQITTKRPQLVRHAVPYFETEKKSAETISSLETLWIIFHKLITDDELGDMFCVLDGLDECHKGTVRLLVSRIIDTLSPTSPCQSLRRHTTKLRLVIVSRELHDLLGCERIKLDPDHNEEVSRDIQRFIATRSDSLARIEGFGAIRAHVQDVLLHRSEGTFLWVGYAMRKLSQSPTCTTILKALDELPEDIPKMYERMLAEIPTEEKQMSLTILRWVAYSFVVRYDCWTWRLWQASHQPLFSLKSKQSVTQSNTANRYWKYIGEKFVLFTSQHGTT